MKVLLENWRRYVNEEQAAGASQELDAAEIVRQAWENTSEGHLQKAFSQRAPGGAGSTFDDGTTLETLRSAGWSPHPDPNAYVRDPARGFVTDAVGGVLGMLPVGSLPDQHEVRFQPAHMGQAKSDTGEAAYEAVAGFEGGRPPMTNTTLLIGPQWYQGHAKDAEKPVIWTFYPGDPAPPPAKDAPRFIVEQDILTKTPNTQKIESGFEDEKGGKMLAYVGTIADAKALGFGNIKYVGK
tara:strand:+ start:4241 stop:4957 length:717 start_codon:yes stop_codon:yes gene_type:complete